MFFVGVYKDQKEARQCIAGLKHYYPEEKIVPISDGTHDSTYEAFCEQVGVDYRVGQRLKLPDFRGAWTERFLHLLDETDDERIIKIDPDTQVNARVEWPDAEIFSSWRDSNGKRILAGPVIGFTRRAARDIIDSGFMLDWKYKANEYTYYRFYPPRLKEGEEQNTELVSLQDEITTDVVERLGIEPIKWEHISLTDTTAAFYRRE